MRKWLASIVILALSFVAIGHAQRGRGAGPGGGPPPPPRPIAGNGVEVPGWWARVDDVKEPTTGLKFSPMSGGLHATTGPNIIFWDPQQMAMGNYTVKASFSVTKQPSHEVSYGLFIGGENLDGDKQKYSYFLIRENGQFLIKKRNGASTSNVAGDWAPNPAIMAIAGGSQKNELSIQVSKERVSFMVNGKEVASHPATAIDTSGVYGLRIGHGMDIQIDGFGVTQ
ncbi:MAG TPA: hypothetical protein VFB92_17555 [Vicinamibacterales bacterium]|jgi:hypothetical protein|nr:hypothetical protein [Vicinamibacterales bacterium]